MAKPPNLTYSLGCGYMISAKALLNAMNLTVRCTSTWTMRRRPRTSACIQPFKSMLLRSSALLWKLSITVLDDLSHATRMKMAASCQTQMHASQATPPRSTSRRPPAAPWSTRTSRSTKTVLGKVSRILLANEGHMHLTKPWTLKRLSLVPRSTQACHTSWWAHQMSLSNVCSSSSQAGCTGHTVLITTIIVIINSRFKPLISMHLPTPLY